MSNPDITSQGAEEKTSSEKKKPVREQKTLTNNNREMGNLEQYILARNIELVKNYSTSNKHLFAYKTYRQVNGPGTQLINRLRGIDNLDVFYKMKTSVLSLMQPKIRLYKVSYEEAKLDELGMPVQGGTQRLEAPCYREFKFSDTFGQETAVSVQDYLAYESTKPTWRNVGLKSFTISQNGETHGIVEQNINCTLTVTFKSLKDLEAQPPGEPPPNKGGVSYVDLILWPAAKFTKDSERINPMHYEIKVLMGYTAPSKESLESLNLSADDLRTITGIEKLNTIVSLSLLDYDLKIKDDGRVDLVATYRGRLETIMATNQVNIFHDSFRVTKAGGFEMVDQTVKAKYNTGHVYDTINSIKTIHKGLKSPKCKDLTCDARKNLISLIELDEVFAQVYSEAQGQGIKKVKDKYIVEGDGALAFSWFKDPDNTDKMLALLKKKIGAYKKDVYRTFMDALIVGNDKDGDPPSGSRLFCIQSGRKEVEKSMGVIVDDRSTTPGVSDPNEETSNPTEEEQLNATSAALPKGDGGVKVGRCPELMGSENQLQLKSETAAMVGSSIEGESASKDKKTGEKAEDASRRASTLSHSGEQYSFYYVYLGDIIELACRNAGFAKLDFEGTGQLQLTEGAAEDAMPIFPTNTYQSKVDVGVGYPLQNARLLLGPIEYISPNDGQIKAMNLAQFPISFNLFRAWFVKNITRRRRTRMPLGIFLHSLMKSLVMPSLSAAMPKSIKAPHTRSSMVSLSLPGTIVPESETITVCGRPMPQMKELLPLKRVINTDSGDFKENYFKKVTMPHSSETLMKTSFDYFLIYVTSAKDTIERSGNPLEDVKDGIYHFNIGSDMGLLKKMKFNKVPIPGLAELRSKQAMDQGVDQLGQLTIPYNTNLTLVGTSLFTPGMFYYVNPSMAGLGSVEDAGSLSYKLNLGGYHVVMKVSTTLTPGKFETVIEGTQTQQGRR